MDRGNSVRKLQKACSKPGCESVNNDYTQECSLSSFISEAEEQQQTNSNVIGC
jgi:hypothetical protein